MTLHDLIADLTKELSLTPEQQFKVTAKVKRLIHNEKHGLCYRLFLYSQGYPIFDKPHDPDNPDTERTIVGYEEPKDPFINNLLKEKSDSHSKLSELPDDQLVTWNVGTHIYK